MYCVHGRFTCEAYAQHIKSVIDMSMNDAYKKMLVAYFNDAHALEESLIIMLEKQIGEIADGEVKAKLEEHLTETKRHAELMRLCLDRYGEEPSIGKDMLGSISSAIAGVGVSLAHDKEVKYIHSSYAAEHAEIATYTIIRSLASDAGDAEAVGVCDEILQDEHNMADFLLEQMPTVVAAHMQKMLSEEAKQ